jgi:hypothetical protein
LETHNGNGRGPLPALLISSPSGPDLADQRSQAAKHVTESKHDDRGGNRLGTNDVAYFTYAVLGPIHGMLNIIGGMLDAPGDPLRRACDRIRDARAN